MDQAAPSSQPVILGIQSVKEAIVFLVGLGRWLARR